MQVQYLCICIDRVEKKKATKPTFIKLIRHNIRDTLTFFLSGFSFTKINDS